MNKSPNPKAKHYFMAGTDGTGEYLVVGKSDAGKLGVRDLGGGRFRLRLEPAGQAGGAIGESLPREGGYKQPGDGAQNRFSKVVDEDGLESTLEQMGQALLGATQGEVHVNSAAPARLRLAAFADR